jgi:hypothetical protein
VIVRTEAGGVWGAPGDLVPELTIGRLDGPDEYVFGEIVALAVAPDGSIYVFDSQAKALRKYAADGAYAASFGRAGGGPGEYRAPDGGLAVLADGRVLLRDPGNARVNVYSAEGVPLESWRIRGGFYSDTPLFTDRDGSVYVMIHLDPASADAEFRYGLVRYAGDGLPRDTLVPPSSGYKPPVVRAQSADGNASITYTVPFTPLEVWTLGPRGEFVVGPPSTRYSLDLRRPGGVLRIERAYEPVPVKPEERDERERIIAATMRRLDAGWRWNGPAIPDTKPPYRRIFTGSDGRIWVQLYQEAERIELDEPAEPREPGAIPEQRWREPTAFDVFEPDGRYLGLVRAPEGFQLEPQPVARGDTVWAVVRGELEVPFVVRFRIRQGAETPSR